MNEIKKTPEPQLKQSNGKTIWTGLSCHMCRKPLPDSLIFANTCIECYSDLFRSHVDDAEDDAWVKGIPIQE